MTSRESGAIEKLRDEVQKVREEMRDYHTDLVKLVENCKPCQADIAKLNLDMYGIEGKKDEYPGVLGHVASLRRSRKLMLLALRGAWVLLTILLGAVMTTIVQTRL